MAKRDLVTLLTDFGTRDPYVAAMKGVLLQACPRARIIDIGHEVPAQDVLTASFLLAQAAPWFPPETLHVAVVDPGVGTERAILAARMGGQIFLCPDNGLLTLPAKVMPLEQLVMVENPTYLPREPHSLTFQGRDVFAPLAGQILNGADLDRLGRMPRTYKILDLREPECTTDGISGEIIYVDRFGNLISNISRGMIQKDPDLMDGVVECAARTVGHMKGTYADAPAGTPLALINSMDLLEVAVSMGRACDEFGVREGAQVLLRHRRRLLES